MRPALVLLLLLWASPLQGQGSPDSEARAGVFVVPGLLVSMGSGAGSRLGGVGHLVVVQGRRRFMARLAGVADLRGCLEAGGAEHGTEIGLQVFAKLNLEAPFGGIGVVVPMGWLS